MTIVTSKDRSIVGIIITYCRVSNPIFSQIYSADLELTLRYREQNILHIVFTRIR